MSESLTGKCIADVIAAVSRHYGVDRVFGLCGGHIMPLWIAVHAGTRIIDIRDERAAPDAKSGLASVQICMHSPFGTKLSARGESERLA